VISVYFKSHFINGWELFDMTEIDPLLSNQAEGLLTVFFHREFAISN